MPSIRVRLRGRTLAVVLVLAAVASAVAASAIAASGAVSKAPATASGRVSIDQTPLCGTPDDSSLRATSRVAPEGFYEYQRWLGSPSSQAAAEAVTRKLDELRGDDGQEPRSFRDEFSRGIVGVVADHVNRKLLVVLDTKLVSAVSVRDQLALISGPLTTEIRPICNSVNELAGPYDAIAERRWHPDARQASFGFYLDAAQGRLHVTFGDASRAVGNALAAQLGDAVVIDYGSPSRLGRLNDGEPHYGGAGIGTASQGNFCTSAFTVIKNGVRGSLTAGHCYGNGTNVYSGPEFYGVTTGKASFPTYDMIRIAPSGETFDNKIHTDPCCPSVRTIVDKGNTSVGQYICVSGMVTRAKCGLEVTSMSATFCDASGCTGNLGFAKKPGETVAQPGDSGGPVYNRYTDPQGAIRGMIIARNTPSDVFFHKVLAIESVLGVTVATS